MDWATAVTTAISAFVGGLIALVGVVITLRHEGKSQKEERIDRAKPIMINYPAKAVPDRAHVPHYHFRASEGTVPSEKYGVFKNTDNGILFLECIRTETKEYFPQRNSAVAKNEAFIVILHLAEGETLTECRIYCHDIFGNKYYYDAQYDYDSDKERRILIGNIQAVK